jgi:hypothetical protein
MTQTDRVLAYMVNHGSITALQAEQHLRCHRLAARIADLRKAGVDIESERVTQDGSSFARYRLVPKPVQMAAFG